MLIWVLIGLIAGCYALWRHNNLHPVLAASLVAAWPFYLMYLVADYVYKEVGNK